MSTLIEKAQNAVSSLDMHHQKLILLQNKTRSSENLIFNLGLIEIIFGVVDIGLTVSDGVGWYTFIGIVGIAGAELLRKKAVANFTRLSLQKDIEIINADKQIAIANKAVDEV